ncbi:acetoacetyl-CoA reductase [Geomicrobium sp. JCM 19037]|uniref:acetoacetyl-CoA reductase n=1 Tax=Geomicrobium sp. JCM 19037 TaxID=1460634 RepID=UPI00045F410B|nr:acetoacetyl-CoA reductase [Geomicrobium sp. JCM 19037]GAK05459.1 acetoacetyl-CoA reductase [Geomicrobium sp. JCM 19037]
MADLKNKVAIVTGGARGIGAAITRELADNGVRVVINYNTSQGPSEKLVQEINDSGGEALAVKGDVSNVEDASKIVEAAVNTFGQLDILVNNAGITRDSTFKKLSEEDWSEVINVNLNSVYNTVSKSLPHLLESESGRIINISSIIGQQGGFGQTNYAAAKAGMIGYTKSLALELARKNITVNAVCPGFIETEMVQEMPEKVLNQIVSSVPVQRLGQAQEIARGVVFLCKDGEYITGQQLNINGGLYM